MCPFTLFAVSLLFVYKVDTYECRLKSFLSVWSTASDWFIYYKLAMNPREREANLKEGLAFLEMNSRSPSWQLSKKSIASTSGTYLADTLSQYYNDEKRCDKFALFYSDVPPDKAEGRNKNADKGVILGDANGIAFLAHSVPKFPPVYEYKWPEDQASMAHTVLCLSLKFSDLEELSSALALTVMGFYFLNVPPKLEIGKETKAFVRNQTKIDPYFCRHYVNIATARRGGTNITVRVFAKAEGCKIDLYDRSVTGSYETSFAVWSQYKNRYELLADACLPPFNTSTLMAPSVRIGVKKRSFNIQRSEDASNLALSVKHEPGVVCLASTDRTVQHTQRGGSIVCLESNDAAKSFHVFLTAGPLGCTRRRTQKVEA